MTGHALLDRTSPSNIWWFSVDVLFMKTKAEVSPFFFFLKKGGIVQVQASLETICPVRLADKPWLKVPLADLL